MGIRGMTDSIKFNDWQKSKRKTIYDLSDCKRSGTYKMMDDHRQMNIHEYATFQKEQFKRRRKEQRWRRLRWLLVLFITLLIVIGFLLAYGFIDWQAYLSPTF
ncbi:hypothetical protein [Altibacter sp. HG106]|uniref:hypothetical protein n=1 Tax=Altibacter sp. HG106 TaxID=3023937 RepID=UPI002350D9A4|nr:hypothetical protein [Altibacter sp. HG106]MDC7993767.1 hypothetical protein [Altibacter sp. HG106]